MESSFFAFSENFDNGSTATITEENSEPTEVIQESNFS